MHRNALTISTALVRLLTGAVAAAEASTQHLHGKGSETLKKLLVILLAGCVFVIGQGFREVVADENGTDGIPLSALAGTYSVTSHGSIFFCVKATPPFPPTKCGSTGSIGFPLSILAVGANTDGCSTLTETDSDLPVDVSPPFVLTFNSVTKVTSYDPETGTGDASFTDYSGGKCNGATFDKTGATVLDHGTEHFAASKDGDQIDFVITSLTHPVGAVGDFSVSGTALRLHHRRNILLP